MLGSCADFADSTAVDPKPQLHMISYTPLAVLKIKDSGTKVETLTSECNDQCEGVSEVTQELSAAVHSSTSKSGKVLKLHQWMQEVENSDVD